VVDIRRGINPFLLDFRVRSIADQKSWLGLWLTESSNQPWSVRLSSLWASVRVGVRSSWDDVFFRNQSSQALS